MQQKNVQNEYDISKNPIIFFDGVCGLCNSFVDIIFQADKNHIFKFSPLQGETAKKYVSELPEDIGEWSIVYIDEKGIYRQSDATLHILCRLGGVWKILYMFIYLPKGIRDFVYGIVAKYRYKIFGKYATCRIPTEDEKSRFLP